jgi:enoyl-CoA hydratase/carnithine racemase
VPIQWELDGEIGLATIDRPERRNALNAELCGELHERLKSNPGLRAVVIAGSGDKAFCAGADLGRRAADVGGLSHGGGDTFRPAFEQLLDEIIAYPAPVVASVNGAALGAGLQLAVACDLRVAAPGATFGVPAARLGVLLNAANIARLATLVGQAMARDLLLSARLLDVNEAEQVGLVQRRANDALGASRALAAELASLAPLSLAGHKRALNLLAEACALTPQVRVELQELEAGAFASADLQEGLAAFAEKRPARFSGR